MMKRAAWIACLTTTLCFCALTAILAQDVTITNAEQLVAVVDQSGLWYPLVSPTESPLSWPALGIFWTDFDQLTNVIGDVRNFEGETQYGVSVWRLRLTRTADETVFSYPAADTNLLQLAASGEDGFSTHYDRALRTWCILGAFRNPESYDDLLADGFTFLDPKRLVLDITIGNINDCSSYEANAAGGSLLMTSEEESGEDLTPAFGIDGDPCAITNLLQAFQIVAISISTNRYTSITWESCPRFRYCVFSADALNTNLAAVPWQPRAYLWGWPNTTTWTDSTTSTSATVTQRFYRVQRLLASPMGAGGFLSLAVQTNRTLWAWGNNGYGECEGELGDGLDGCSVEPYRPFPGEVANVTSCTGQTVSNAVSLAGDDDGCAVVADVNGVVWTFGEAEHGQLGNGTYGPNRLVPSPISGVSNVVSVAAGALHTLALRADGTVWAWGVDSEEFSEGDLGVGGLASGLTNSPIRSLVPTQTVVVAIAAGCHHSVALDATGGVWTWGNGREGELGNGGTTNVTIPMLVTGISNVIAIAAGCGHTIALTADKRVWTWGDGASGDLGRSGSNTVPGLVSALTNMNVVAIAGGYQFTMVVTSNGLVYAWGVNANGELGTNVGSSSTPIPVAGISNAVLVSAHPSGSHSLAMTVDGGTNRYWGWGYNVVGQVGNSSTSDQYSPAQLQFCTRCQRCVQLGTSGSFTAQCNGTMYLYFNDDQTAFGDNTGSYTVSLSGGLSTNVNVLANNVNGVAVGSVTNGGVYTFSASGFCTRRNDCIPPSACETDPNGNDHSTNQVDCSSFSIINITNAVCPTAKCFSLVGKIQ